tara:strand:+ start:628 stop:963 length:336 start_codon:yes stop_codon:yes gene_type:complete
MKLTTKQLKQIIKEELKNLQESWGYDEPEEELDCQQMKAKRDNLNWMVEDIVSRFITMSSDAWEWMRNDLWAAASGDADLKSYYPEHTIEQIEEAAQFLDDWHDGNCGDDI